MEFSSSSMICRFTQSKKALGPMNVTLDGIKKHAIFVNANAFFSIMRSFELLGISNKVRVLHKKKRLYQLC